MNRHSRSTHPAVTAIPLSINTSTPHVRRFHRNVLLLAIASCSLHTQAQTGQQVEEIIVTADFRHAQLDSIPASIIVLDSALMQQKNALHLEDVLLNAPNVNFASGTSRARYVQLRGIGETSQFTEPLNPSVGLLIDGVDFSGIGAAAMLYDIEQVEILQGPQGTRYGSNALAGLINLQSKGPTEALTAGVQMQAENYDGHGLAGHVAGPLGDTLGFRISGQSLRSDGFSNNTFLQRPTNQRNEQTLRGNLVWQPTPTLTVDTRAGVIDVNNGYDVFSLDNIRDTLSDQPGHDDQLSRYGSVKATSTASSAVTVEVLASIADSSVAYSYDEDWVYAGFHPDEYSSIDSFVREHDTKSAELRLLSSPQTALFAGRTTWVAGLYTLDQEVDQTRVYTYAPSDFHSAYAMRRHAVYADTSTTLTQRLSFDAGVRVERFSASYDDSNALHFSPDEDLLGGKLALNYHTANDNLLYVSASRGYKTGGFNTEGSLDADLREFGSEKLWNYEVGFKGSLLDDRLQTRLAVFYMDRDDVQVQSSTLRMRDNGSTEFIEFTGNAAAGINRGAELALDFALSDSVQLYGTLGLLDSEYRNFINSNGDDLDGREQAHAPSYQYTVGGRWQLLPSLVLDMNVQGRDDFYFSDSHDVRSNAYDLLNASLTWTQNQWQLTLWGRNLTDEDYLVRGFYFGNDPRDGYTSKGYTQLGEPLRYGLTMNFQF